MSQGTDIETVRAQIAALTVFPEQLRRQLVGLRDEQLRFRPAPAEWSIVEVIGHLIDIEVLMRGRIGKIISSDNPPLSAIDINATVRERDYQQKQAIMLLHSFGEQRAETIEQLRVLRPDALSRTGAHPTRGPLSIAEIVALLARHDPTHATQIEDNLAAFDASR